MTDLERVLIERFGEKNVRSIDVAADEMPLLEVNFEVKNQMKILITNGLSEYKMPVPEKEIVLCDRSPEARFENLNI